MKVYGLIIDNCNKKLKITIVDNESDEKITCFDKSTYINDNLETHIYDDRDVVWWEIKRGGLFIYID